ncbi:hypothetical protein [Kitasatospora sp. NPDC058478]|uniref:hypothetical protein n=1 Tax=unclassified Kitasatospora TaxID=2633591 RepID=UPI0036584992
MDSAIITPVLSTAAATISGIGAALLTSGRTLKLEQRRQQADRDRETLTARRDSYAAVLRAGTLVVNRWWEVVDLVGVAPRDRDRAAVRDAYVRVLASWDEYSVALQVARMNWPPDDLGALDDVSSVMEEFDRSGNVLYASAGSGRVVDRDLELFRAALGRWRLAIREFGQHAGSIVNAPDPRRPRRRWPARR